MVMKTKMDTGASVNKISLVLFYGCDYPFEYGA